MPALAHQPSPQADSTASEVERLIRENHALRLRAKELERQLADTVDLLHVWKSHASAYRLRLELRERPPRRPTER